MQPIAAHSYMEILVSEVIPQKFSHWSPALPSFYPLWANYPPPPHPFYTTLFSLAAQLFPRWTNIPLILHYNNPLGSWPLTSYYPLWKNYPPHAYTVLSPGSSTLPSLYPLWTNFTPLLQRFTFFLPMQTVAPHSYMSVLVREVHPKKFAAQLLLLSSPLSNLLPTRTPLYTLGSSTLTSFYTLWTNTPLLLHHFNPLGSPPLPSFNPLWTNFPPIADHCTHS